MTDEQAMRFGYLLSEIEMQAKNLLAGTAPDILLALAVINDRCIEATVIAREVSREALDKVVNEDG